MKSYLYILLIIAGFSLTSCPGPVCCGPKKPTNFLGTIFTNENTNYLQGLDTTTFKFYFFENNEKKFLETGLYNVDQDTSYFQGMYIRGYNELHEGVPDLVQNHQINTFYIEVNNDIDTIRISIEKDEYKKVEFNGRLATQLEAPHQYSLQKK